MNDFDIVINETPVLSHNSLFFSPQSTPPGVGPTPTPPGVGWG